MLCRALTKDDLIKELSRGHQPICVVEHKVPTSETVQDCAKLFPNGRGGLNVKAFVSNLSSSWGTKFGTTAYALLDELNAASPETKFIVTSHIRGSGIPPEQRARYKQRKEVLKVMGFTNSPVNYRYLMSLFSRVYLGTTWKQLASHQG